ncbi:tRNA uridine-5-carboxymethylaminomethyl(34) synthesis GTPase MnmE [Flaviaesturariibacter aridisoli]|uniref:tRNA modification GTPase MnmE n=1 Tax=Flaviaesturariibacter aridisoli TaxID=2545761 RepID=A0A4R4E451_9BACT|nr:tRNA uridine-5-carboxymethylaminomethyl(34) synthesis GTPase MnmE [Flaviaesturariibacter aridisoli]TCZ73717.1 tRNA uridine-5-carboxymethylaminomethyl(34) synthesis GTPase MnmE [Flaviaesturariibacter aridisoli]
MLNKLSGWSDTIVALATPPGIGAIGVIRLSGPQALSIANRLFPAKDVEAQRTHTLHVGILHQAGEDLDEVVLSLFKAPRSYTGEHVVELSCHGSPYVQQRIIEACIAEGARLAKPGEFTQRAFLNGKLDLAQAESVADLIASNTAASARTALQHIRGGFSKALAQLREQLLQFSALIELELDFSQEDVEFADRTRLRALLHEARTLTGQLLQSFRLGNVVRNGVSVAIIGRPNAGKSTLLNALLNEERAIVSAIPGTTRDTIEETLNIDGILFRLIDTAGIRSHTADVIESAGIEKSRQKLQGADLVLFLADALGTSPVELRELESELADSGKPFLSVANKVDAAEEAVLSARWQERPDLVYISAKAGRGIDTLKAAMVAKVLEGATQTESVVVTNARHYAALQEVARSVQDVLDGLDNGLPGDLLALDIRRCLHFLGEITGEITNEDQLDYIFSKFCIGK